ncbi:hypothetical protein ACFQYP_16225 [Nonomuraea antimicrobica]
MRFLMLGELHLLVGGTPVLSARPSSGRCWPCCSCAATSRCS